MDKYEYLAVEDLGYKPRVVRKIKFEYSPLGEALNKGLKKMYDSVHNFNKCSVFNFNKITSVDSRR